MSVRNVGVSPEIALAGRRRAKRDRAVLPAIVIGVIIVVCGFLAFYPGATLLLESLNAGDSEVFPPVSFGFVNYVSVLNDIQIVQNTLIVAIPATVLAVGFGFGLAWILVRTDLPGRQVLLRLMELPYYLTPLVGAIGWEVLCGEQSGLINQAWRWLGFKSDLFNVGTPFGIAWVMALFEGTVAFVMIAASLRSMDPTLEDSSRVLGGGGLYTLRRITAPLMTPGILGATVFVFAEMLGAFAAALVIGLPIGFRVITTSIWESVLTYPPDYGHAAAMGVVLFLVMCVMLLVYRWIVTRGNYVTITGKAYRPRTIRTGRAAWALAAVCWAYVFAAVVLPLAALVLTSFQTFATVMLGSSSFTLDNYRNAFQLGGVVTTALYNSVSLGVWVASISVFVMGIVVWIIYRSRLPGRGLVEYVVMFPQAVPRMIFGLALLWAWINMPIPLYGTKLLIGIAYFTVFMPLAVRTLAGVVVQLDKSLEECARMCGASWLRQMRTVTLPLMRPGILAAWFLLFTASVRELGASIFLIGPHSKVIAPAIVAAWHDSGTEQVAAMAVIQTGTVLLAVVLLFALSSRMRRLTP